MSRSEVRSRTTSSERTLASPAARSRRRVVAWAEDLRHQGRGLSLPRGDRADIARGQWVDARGSSVLLADYSKAWLQERTVRGRPLAPRTTDTYRHSLNAWILPTLGDLPLDKITPAHVRRWHAEVSSQTGLTRSARRTRCFVRS